MIKVYCCKSCKRVSYHAKRKNMICNACDGTLFRLSMSYKEYTFLNLKEREAYIKKCFEEEKRKIL